MSVLLVAMLWAQVAMAEIGRPLITGIHSTDYRYAAALGTRLIRLWDFKDVLRGNHIEPQTNQWVDCSAELAKMHRAGLTPVAVLYTRQPWRCAADGLPDLTLHNGTSLWMDYVDAVTQRYRAQVRYWEVWNEPDTIAFGGRRTPAEYVEMVRQAALVIRRNHAGTVIAGSVSSLDSGYMAAYLAAGLAQHCDIISFHYTYTGDPSPDRQRDYIDLVRRLRFTTGRPVWNTETSILRYLDEGGGPNLPEADALDRILRVNRAAGVQAVFYYYLGPATSENPESLMNWRGQLRPWARVLRKY